MCLCITSIAWRKRLNTHELQVNFRPLSPYAYDLLNYLVILYSYLQTQYLTAQADIEKQEKRGISSVDLLEF